MESTKANSVQNSIPKIRQDLLKWNGWGFKDSGFKGSLQGSLEFVGGRYISSEPIFLPHFNEFVFNETGRKIPPATKSMAEPISEEQFPPSLIPSTSDFLQKLDKLNITYSVKGMDRLFRSHGHTLEDIFDLRTGRWGRIPDIVIWPECHVHVEQVVQLAVQVNYVIIPFGGGTSVTHALKCPADEMRPIISLDTSQMSRILSVDEDNLTIVAEAGITGQDLESQLKVQGYTVGHEPDSYEFSTLGGWVATRASGMKKNTYGNIEDIILHVKFVSPSGVLEKYCNIAPRISSGPDIHHLIMGSEGTLGVVTEVTLKIRPLPQTKRYGSIVFPEFLNGVQYMREIAKQRCQPSSIRLMDNAQFTMGKAFHGPMSSFDSMKESLKMLYLTKWKGYDLNYVCVATLLFEGNEQEVAQQEARIYEIASKFGGIPAGETNGQRGYNLTFVVAYIRDYLLDNGIYGESFETSVPWSKAYNLCENVKLRVKNAGRELGVSSVTINCRVTQTYDSGCCIYFYMAIPGIGVSDPVGAYTKLEEIARDEIIANSGSISHHHGVGKIRRKWIPTTLSNPAIQTLKNIKKNVDPKNIFANRNIFQDDPHAQDGF